jgi:hypothetical protein
MYPHNVHLLQPGSADPRRRAHYVAAALRHREAGRRAAEALPALADRLRAGVRITAPSAAASG